MSGKIMRLKRILKSSKGKMLILTLDHGVTGGPASGLRQIDRVIRLGIRGGADALVLHKGMIPILEKVDQTLPGVFMHLSASTNLGQQLHRKMLVGSVEEAMQRGADGVSMQLNLGGDFEGEMIRDLGLVGSACARWQMPLLVMAYVEDGRMASPAPDEALAHGARLAAELGADIVKIPVPTQVETLSEITASLPVPVVIAGGAREEDTRLFLEKLARTLAHGVRGFAIGRNVFQHERPEALLTAITNMVHLGFSAETAWRQFCEME